MYNTKYILVLCICMVYIYSQMELCTISGVQENERPRAISLAIPGEPSPPHLQRKYIYCSIFSNLIAVETSYKVMLWSKCVCQ